MLVRVVKPFFSRTGKEFCSGVVLNVSECFFYKYFAFLDRLDVDVSDNKFVKAFACSNFSNPVNFLRSHKLDELKQIASEFNCSFPSNIKKSDLINLLSPFFY